MAGFDAVEFWWPFQEAVPAADRVDEFVHPIQDADVRLSGLNFFAGDMPGGDRGLVSWPERSSECVENIDVTVQLGRRLGCTAFNALYGNRVDGVDPDEQDALGTENLVKAAAAVAEIGGTVLVEPVSGSESYPLLTAADALAVIDRAEQAGVGTNLALLADLFHLTVNGDDVFAVIAEHVDRIGHVQIADAPGRGEPGSGDMPIPAYVEALQSGGYAGWVGLEYAPTTARTADSFGWRS